jgi:hypothetical protein
MSKSESGWGRYGFRKVCTSGMRLDRPPGPVRPPYPAKYELGVVFWHAFVRVSTPNGARPPLPINIKGHGRLKDYPQSNLLNLSFIVFTFSFSLPYFSNPMCCSSTTSAAWEGVLAGLPSLGQTKVRLPRRGPSRVSVRWSLAGEPGDPGLTAPPMWSDRPTWRRCKELLNVLVGSEKASTNWQLHWGRNQVQVIWRRVKIYTSCANHVLSTW